jgi:hypothetical protein
LEVLSGLLPARRRETARRGIESSQLLGRHRWVVERTFAWLARFRRLTIRYERRADIHHAFLPLATTYAIRQTPAETEINDAKQHAFKPQAKPMQWKNETNFSLHYIAPDTQKQESYTEGNGVIRSKGSTSARFFQTPDQLDPSVDGLEIEIVFSEKPSSNQVRFSVNARELGFFYHRLSPTRKLPRVAADQRT